MYKIFFSFWLLSYSYAVYSDTVVWLYTDWPPHHILDGEHAGQGTFDQIQQRLIAGLPQYQHETRLTSVGRIEHLFAQSTQTYCITGTLFSQERAAQRYYSVPMAVGAGYYINYLADSAIAEYLQLSDHVDLVKLSTAGIWLGVYPPHRKYPPVIVEAFQQATAEWLSSEFNNEVNPVALLRNGRVDYILEYPERITYYQQRLGAGSLVKTAAITGAEKHAVLHVTCTKTALGQHLMDDINQQLSVMWQQEDYQDLVFAWLTPEVRALLEPIFNEIRQRLFEKNRP